MRFIVIDGLDAAGKDTQAHLLKKKYSDVGEDVILRSHPSSDNFFGKKAERALMGRGDFSRLLATVYFTLDVINSLLKVDDRAETVIFVRYLCSVAYLPDPLVSRAYRFFSRVLPTSSYMFFLDVDPDEAIERINKRDDRQIFENKKDLEKARRRALSVVDEWHVIDASSSVREVQRDFCKILDTSKE
ncbi:MAG: thymidylate kinase [Thermoplasmata archaeon]